MWISSSCSRRSRGVARERLREFARGRRDGFPADTDGLVLADAEFGSERNHTYIRKQLGAQGVIPAKRGKKTWRIHGVRAEMRRAFPRRIYRRRALIESLFSLGETQTLGTGARQHLAYAEASSSSARPEF